MSLNKLYQDKRRIKFNEKFNLRNHVRMKHHHGDKRIEHHFYQLLVEPRWRFLDPQGMRQHPYHRKQ